MSLVGHGQLSCIHRKAALDTRQKVGINWPFETKLCKMTTYHMHVKM